MEKTKHLPNQENFDKICNHLNEYFDKENYQIIDVLTALLGMTVQISVNYEIPAVIIIGQITKYFTSLSPQEPSQNKEDEE